MKITKNMRKLFFAFVVLLFASCTSRPLQLSDLEFEPVYDYWVYNSKEALIANQIDTMFLIIDPNSEEKLNLISWNNDVPYRTDTFEYYVYNENGRVVEIQCFSAFYENDKFQYDSIGLWKEYRHFSDYKDRQIFSYRFVPESLLLYRYHYDYNKPDSVFAYTQFKFDKQGKILEKKSGRSDSFESDYYDKTIYKYNDLGQLLYVQTTMDVGSIEEEEYGHQNYFYTEDKLDSVISQIAQKYGGGAKPSKLYYDEQGLCYQVIKGNRTINCIYKQRK